MAHGIDLLEDAPFECLFTETQPSPSEDFIMGSVMPAPPKLEDGGQATVDDLIEVNLGMEDDFRLTFISVHLSSKEHILYRISKVKSRCVHLKLL